MGFRSSEGSTAGHSKLIWDVTINPGSLWLILLQKEVGKSVEFKFTISSTSCRRSVDSAGKCMPVSNVICPLKMASAAEETLQDLISLKPELT